MMISLPVFSKVVINSLNLCNNYSKILLGGGGHAEEAKMLNGFIKMNPEVTDGHFYDITPILRMK